MHRRIIVLILFFCCISMQKAKATHALGSEIRVEYVSASQYKVKLSIYRDCNGVNLPSTQTINWTGSCGSGSSNAIRVLKSDVTNVCASQTSACNRGGGAYGIEKHNYETTLSFPPGCMDVNLYWELCCRNRAITSFDGNANQMYNEVFIKDPSQVNYSPEFIFGPSAFFPLINKPIINFQCSDQDGDSLVYRLVSPQGQSGNTVSYYPGYSVSAPLGAGITVSLDPIDGLMALSQTNSPEVGVVAVEIDEYRNGIKIGSIRRDMNLRLINQVLNLSEVSPLIGDGGLLSADTVLLLGEPFHADVYVTRINR
ncbi:MAG: hypothetical protein JKY48_18130, partial [Flavobacteriales bacterium]|nr:hypothetical protein [Flavobacteriales bacterium]